MCPDCEVAWKRFPGGGLDVQTCWICRKPGRSGGFEAVVFPRREVRNPSSLSLGADGHVGGAA